MRMSTNVAVGLTVAAALAVPGTALARHGSDDNTLPSSNQAQGQPGADDHGSNRAGSSLQPRLERYELRGSVVSTDATADTVVVLIKKANHGRRGRALVGQQVTVDLSTARLRVTDSNGDGVRDVNDVQAGDPVAARVQLPKGQPADLSQPVAASRFDDRASRSTDDTPSHS